MHLKAFALQPGGVGFKDLMCKFRHTGGSGCSPGSVFLPPTSSWRFLQFHFHNFWSPSSFTTSPHCPVLCLQVHLGAFKARGCLRYLYKPSLRQGGASEGCGRKGVKEEESSDVYPGSVMCLTPSLSTWHVRFLVIFLKIPFYRWGNQGSGSKQQL